MAKTLAKKPERKKFRSTVEQTFNLIYSKKSDFWKKEREKQAISLFESCAEKVPAYKDFLLKNGIESSKIKTFEDFQTVPSITKENYLRKYSLEDLCMQGTLAQSLVFTSTSGSTGVPFYFPRNGILDWQSSIYHEMFLRASSIDKKKSTLILVCFGMGVWIGGVITYEAFKTISERGYPLTILTPGVNKKEIYEALKNLGPKFDQVILCGYPPFMKDVIDEAKDNGVNWHNYDLKIVFAAEAFSEKFRDYILRKTGIKDVYRDTMNIYGSADLGTMAEETPISILIRRLALKNKKIYQRLFKDANRLPTLAQFNPYFINFESVDGRVFCTGNNALPLIRYEIGDNGGVTDYSDIEMIFKEEGMDLHEEARKVGIENTITELPFVYVYERTDLSTKLYGAIIYPEYVKLALQDVNIEKYITGKFTMYTQHDENQNEYLEINVELKPGTTESEWLKNEVERLVSQSLLEKSAEHKNNAHMMPGRVNPRIVFWPHEHPNHFQVGIKQKWVKKQ
jgi:phenylacetate-CoA ligase